MILLRKLSWKWDFRLNIFGLWKRIDAHAACMESIEERRYKYLAPNKLRLYVVQSWLKMWRYNRLKYFGHFSDLSHFVCVSYLVRMEWKCEKLASEDGARHGPEPDQRSEFKSNLSKPNQQKIHPNQSKSNRYPRGLCSSNKNWIRWFKNDCICLLFDWIICPLIKYSASSRFIWFI